VDDVAGVLEAARDAYGRHDWVAARERFHAARAEGELAPGDLDALADAAWWLGDFEEASAVLEEAYRRHLDDGRPRPAARFEVRDAAGLSVEEPFDVVFVFDAIHDQVDPAAVLARIHAALAPGGTFVMVEPRASSDLAGNLGNPLAPMLYSVSTLHCLTVSLAGGGAGLGAAWGEELTLAMLAEAGFGDVVVHDAPGDPLNGVFVAAKARA
jgi:SAM-dependent methyltransferase